MARAPGRVNLIGEHTDYNDGYVLPAAIAYDTRVEAHAREDRVVRVRSDRYPHASIAFELGAVPRARRGDWGDYPRGVLLELEAAAVPLHGAELSITASVPLEAGLSSSASFEVGLALSLLAISEQEMTPLDIALLAQRAEVQHVGTRSGIMDQFASLFGRAGRLIMLDTRTMRHEMIALPAGARLIVANTMVKHRHATGGYNDRRAECEAAVTRLQTRYPGVRALRDVTLAMLNAARDALSETLLRRARHVITENERVLAAADALKAGDLARVGMLLDASHESLRNDFDVSCDELDLMVRIAREFRGCYGTRLTGGGFGGCTISVVDADAVESFQHALGGAYHRETGIVPEFYDGTPAAGADVRAQ